MLSTNVDREEYQRVRGLLDQMAGRLRATIYDVVRDHGIGSPEHLRLRFALTGEGEGAPSAAAVAANAHSAPWGGPEVPATTRRFNVLRDAMPDDPRDWWTGEESDQFISAWERLDLPDLTMADATGERLTLWCTAMEQAAGLLDMDVVGGQGFEIVAGEYVVTIVQSKEIRTVRVNDKQGDE